MLLRKFVGNPVLTPNPQNWLEAEAVFNPTATFFSKKVVILYRAISKPIPRSPYESIKVSTIFYAESDSGYDFRSRRMFFGPELPWESYATEDPRVTHMNGTYFITYTAVSSIPPRPETVRLTLALTEDFSRIVKIGPICPYNSKAGFLFPKKFDGRYLLALTINPDLPPSKIILVEFNKFEDLLDSHFWSSAISEARVLLSGTAERPFVELGTPPIELDCCWLLFLPDIVYENGHFREFRVKAALLDKNDPSRIISISKKPILLPTLEYELTYSEPLRGIVFPTGALRMNDGRIVVYYGAADKYAAVAEVEEDCLVRYLLRGG